MIGCEHCSNPDKSNLAGCRYTGGYPSRAAFLLSTFDAPCVCDKALAEFERAASRDRRRIIGLFVIALAVAVVAIKVFI